MPAAWTPLSSTPTLPGSQAFLRLEGQAFEVRACSIGPTPPADPVEGMLWVDNSASPYRVYVYARIDAGGAAWQPLGPLSRLPSDLNFDPSIVDDRLAPFQAKGMRLENRNALPAVSPTNRGMLVFRLGDGEVYVSDEGVSGAWKCLLSVVAGVSLDSVEVDLTAVVLGATPPTAASKGATPAVRGYLFDDPAESLTVVAVVPKNYSGAGDLVLDLDCVLNQAEASGDDIDWAADLVAVVPGAAGSAVTRPPTLVVPVLTDIGANAGDGALHRCRLVLDHDDPANPITPGALLAIEIHRTGLAEVGGVVLVAARLGYPQRARHERA
ncbi:MAG: hypothetical protein HUU06_06695 [Planctomycetaceae bacterium]|nr:hypothetical protein [Planctomycetota bacterium]NUN52459.1 hypothetical protein [Planctomycetaceae bacterium]